MRFVPDHRGIGQMLRGPEMHKMVRDFAEVGKLYAEAIAPVGEENGGTYKSSFEIQMLLLRVTKRPGRRATARLINTADHASAVEFTHGNGHGYHVLNRTVSFLEGWHP